MADRFIDSFPTLAKAGKGNDPEYAKWFHQARKECERGHIIYAFAEMESCYDEGHLFMTSNEKSAFPFLESINLLSTRCISIAHFY